MKNKKILCFITFGLVIAVLCSTLCFSSFASSTQLARVPTHSPSAIPTDLTGYTVTVPAGWTASAGYGKFNLIGSAGWDGTIMTDIQGFGVGVDKSWNDFVGSCAFTTNYSRPNNLNTYARMNTNSITLIVTGGSDVSNSALIQWLIDNNAEFSSSGSNTTYTINEGYYLPTSSIDITDETVSSIGVGNTLIYEMPASNGWINNDGFTTYIDNIRFTLVSSNRSGTAYRIDVSYYDGYENVVLATYVKASSGTVQYTASYGFKAFYIDEPFEVDSLGNELFNGLFTFSQYEPGAPIPPPDVSSVLETFLQGVANALDIDIFGYFSILDLIKILVAASFIVWLLKMLAGG